MPDATALTRLLDEAAVRDLNAPFADILAGRVIARRSYRCQWADLFPFAGDTFPLPAD